jgi:VWFA-related protein
MEMRPMFAAVAAAAAFAAAAYAQEQPPVFRVGSELVVIDLIATDRAGRFVADLQPGEIQILEDGKPQKVQFLRLLSSTPPLRATDPAGPPSAAAPATAAAADSGPSEVRVAIVLDLGSMPPEAFPVVRSSVLEMLRDELPAGVPVMIATVGPQVNIRQPFTTDRAPLIQAVENLPPALERQATFEDLIDTTDRLCASRSSGQLSDAAIAAGKDAIAEANRRAAGTSRALSVLARSLAAAPGRKHVVLYSAGHVLNPVSQVVEAVAAGLAACSGADMQAARRRASLEMGSSSSDAIVGLRTAVDRANRSQVSFYVVDPRGLMTTGGQAQYRGTWRTGGRGAMVKLPTLDHGLSQDYLRTLAADTGGRAFLNTNDIGSGLRRAWQDADAYYLVGYAPAAARKSGRFRRVSVKIARPDLDLRHRQGYYEASDKDRADADITEALAAPDAFDREGFAVIATVDGSMLRIAVHIPPAAIRFTPSGAEHHADFSVHGELRDMKGALVYGKPLEGRDVALRLSGDRLAEIRSSDRVGVRLETPAPPPGTYRLAIVARDSGGWIAVRRSDVVINP